MGEPHEQDHERYDDDDAQERPQGRGSRARAPLPSRRYAVSPGARD